MTSALRDNGPEQLATVGVPIRPEAVSDARVTVRRAAAAVGLSADRTDDLIIAVSEACTNALEAQIAAGITTPIEVSCAVVGHTLEVRIRDHGVGFAPDELPVRPPLHHAQHLEVERGWGIQLMRQLADEVLFDISGDGTTVCLRMHL